MVLCAILFRPTCAETGDQHTSMSAATIIIYVICFMEFISLLFNLPDHNKFLIGNFTGRCFKHRNVNTALDHLLVFG